MYEFPVVFLSGGIFRIKNSSGDFAIVNPDELGNRTLGVGKIYSINVLRSISRDMFFGLKSSQINYESRSSNYAFEEANDFQEDKSFYSIGPSIVILKAITNRINVNLLGSFQIPTVGFSTTSLFVPDEGISVGFNVSCTLLRH